MKLYQISLLPLFIFISTAAASQESISAKLGAGIASSNFYYPSDVSASFTVGFSSQFRLNYRFAITSGVLLYHLSTKENYESYCSRCTFYVPRQRVDHSHLRTYAGIPIMATLKFKKLEVSAGPQVSILIYGLTETNKFFFSQNSYESEKVSTPKLNSDRNRNLGSSIGTRVELAYHLSNRLSLEWNYFRNVDEIGYQFIEQMTLGIQYFIKPRQQKATNKYKS